MDSNTGGQFSNGLNRDGSISDPQRRTAVDIARQKVLATYNSQSRQGIYSTDATSVQPAQASSTPTATPSHFKDTPVATSNSDAWKTYHSAWQNYYQKYYSEYYSNAARNYIARERLKDARERAEEEEIVSSLSRFNKNEPLSPSGLSLGTGGTPNPLNSDPSSPNNANNETAGIRENLRKKIRQKATDSAKKSRRHRRFIPILAGVAVALFILFLQYNRLIFAPIMAYVSPGNTPASEIEALDPTITQAVSSDPRLIIPKLNIDVPINFDVALADVMSAMNHGVAHYRIAGASAYPGEIGNFIITGHSAGDVYSSNPYKYIFSGLERLEEGDLIYVNYKSVRYTYKVTQKQVIEPTNVAALVMQTDRPLITLVTCTPLGTSRYRLLVTGEQISPSYDGASYSDESGSDINVDDGSSELPSNEPSFFEGIWNWLTGQ
ncbi:class E sortase [Candidatus Saccharibacteria bacterium]|nr:class E sortase [Candidatus Saccharibacteria bacterium]